MSTAKREIENQIERNYQVVIEDALSYTTTLGNFTLEEAKDVLAIKEEQGLSSMQDIYIYDFVNKEIFGETVELGDDWDEEDNG
jgi:hypothetical protein